MEDEETTTWAACHRKRKLTGLAWGMLAAGFCLWLLAMALAPVLFCAKLLGLL